jgi:hypothetical protein
MAQRKLSTNWISAYSTALEPISEAPAAYIIWTAISVISAVLKKKVHINRGTYKVYPNQYIVLVGPPGVGKGTAIHPAHAFIKDYTPKLSNYLSDRITAQAIIQRLAAGFQSPTIVNGVVGMSTESTAVLMATELSTFLGSSDWMTQFLCDTWDRNEFEYDTKNKGSSHIKDMCVSLVGACVPEYIRKINGKVSHTDAINGGFTARTIFVFANEPSKKLPWPKDLKDIKNGPQLVADLRYDLEQISQLNGEFSLDSTAYQLFEDFYHKLKQDDSDSDVVRHFKSRQIIHILKVAMCFSAAAGDSLVIDAWAMNTAIALVGNILKTLDVTFRGVGESSLAEATGKVYTFIERKGMTSRRELIKNNYRHATMEDIDRIINTLMTMGAIRQTSSGGMTYYHLVKPLKTTP